LARLSFFSERKVAGALCELHIRLSDGRLLALEWKVSNRQKDLWKQLQREVGGKADTWRREFEFRVMIGAMLAGVFALTCVLRSQEAQGVTIFWQQGTAHAVYNTVRLEPVRTRPLKAVQLA
jgi:hypothetical protein